MQTDNGGGVQGATIEHPRAYRRGAIGVTTFAIDNGVTDRPAPQIVAGVTEPDITIYPSQVNILPTIRRGIAQSRLQALGHRGLLLKELGAIVRDPLLDLMIAWHRQRLFRG